MGQQSINEAKSYLKAFFIQSINTDKTILSVKDTALEPIITLNHISFLYDSLKRNMMEDKKSLGLSESEITNIIKNVANEIMDLYLSNSEQFYIE